MTKRSSFTLIELLVVIAIIAVLAGLLLPAVMSGSSKAKEAKARGQIKNLQIAIEQYMQEYSVVPVSTPGDLHGGAAYGTLITILQEDNARSLNFLNIQDEPGDYVDPWDRQFHIVIDSDYNGEVTADGTTVYATSAIWTEEVPNSTKVLKSWD